MSPELLTSKQIKALKEHKYSAQGQSLTEPLMQVYWKWLVEQIPMTWAPNCLTLVGLLMNVVSTVILVLYTPDGLQKVTDFNYI